MSRKQKPRHASRRWILSLTLFGAGLCGLVLEVVWIRNLGLVFGANTHAMSTVLAAYMAGLALGSLLVGRWAGRPERTRIGLSRTYAILLAGLGVTGVLVTLFSTRISVVAVPLLRAVGWNSGVSVAIRGLMGFVILLVPTFIIGGMLPVVAQLSVEDSSRVGQRLAMLYFVNTLGSVAGTLLAGFLLLEKLGVTGTALLAGIVSLLLAPFALAVGGRTVTTAHVKPQPGSAQQVHYSRPAVAVLVIGFAVSGFAALGYEVTWTRALVMVLGQPIYGATVVLAAFLLGLAVGSIAAGRLSDRWSDPLLGFGIVELIIGISAALTLAVLARSPAILVWITDQFGATWAGLMFGLAGFCLGAMLLPAFWMGTTFPIANRAFVPELRRLGAKVGTLYAVNTVGALLGSIVTGFFIIPALGTVQTNLLLAGLSLAVGAAAVLSAKSSARVKMPVLAVLGGVLVLVAVFATPHRLKVLPPTLAVDQGTTWQVSFHKETVEGIVTTAQSRAGDRQTWVNSSVVCGSGLPALKPVRQMGIIPFAVRPAPRDILIIGYGLGVAASLLVDISRHEVDCVEIAPAVVEASREFARWNNRVYDNARLNIMAGDGRNYLLCTDKKYDAISCDPTHPALGSGALYTREFYELCNDRLRDGGILTMYLPFHLLESRHFRMLLNTFRVAFPECALWRGIAHCVLVGRKSHRVELDPGHLTELFDRLSTSTQMALSEVFVDGPVELLSGMVLDSEGLASISQDAGLFVDDQPELEYVGARAPDNRTWRENAQLVLDNWTGPGEALLPGDSVFANALSSAMMAEKSRFQATIHAVAGKSDDQIRELERALEYNPEDREAQHILRMSTFGRSVNTR
ncbi:MAG: fused MFS/spermidine synthase [candidate division WOR-3 bacterium]|nr:MAG: fused MFS/spermidine synthase [candidate division WOR-3 bacterium]